MLPKSGRAKTTSDFRPIAIVLLFYKVFAHMLLARIEPLIEAGQPEEQHGFRPNRRLEEHLVTANLVVDKFSESTCPCGSSAWTCQKLSTEWIGTNCGPHSWTMAFLNTLCGSYNACISASVAVPEANRTSVTNFQLMGACGCVLSPRLFTGVLQWAMRKWRSKVESAKVRAGMYFAARSERGSAAGRGASVYWRFFFGKACHG